MTAARRADQVRGRALQQYNALTRLQYDGIYVAYSTVLQAGQALFPAELKLVSIGAAVFTSSVNNWKVLCGGSLTQADRRTGSTPPSAPPSTLPPPSF